MPEEDEVASIENDSIKEKFDPIFEKEIDLPVIIPKHEEKEIKIDVKDTPDANELPIEKEGEEEFKIVTKVPSEENQNVVSILEDLPQLKLELKYTSHPICMKPDNSNIKMVDLSSSILKYRDYPIAPDGNIPNSEIRSILKVPFKDCRPIDIHKPMKQVDDSRLLLEEILMKYLPEELIHDPPSNVQTNEDLAKLAESRHTRIKTVVNLDDSEDLNKDLMDEANSETFMDGIIQNISMKTSKSKRKKYARQITKAAMMNQMDRKIKEKEEKRKNDIAKEEQRKQLQLEENILRQSEISKQDSIDVDILDTLDKKLKDTTVIAKKKESEQFIVATKVNPDQLIKLLFKEFGEEKTYILIHDALKNNENAKASIDKVVKGRQNRLGVLKAITSNPYVFLYVAYNIGGEDVLIKIPLMMEDEKFGDKNTLERFQAQVSDILGNETKMVKFLSHLNWSVIVAHDKIKTHTKKSFPDMILSAFQGNQEALNEFNDILGGEKHRLTFMDLIRLCKDKEIEDFHIPVKKVDSIKLETPRKHESMIMKEIRKMSVEKEKENDFYGNLTEEQKRLLPSLPEGGSPSQEFVGTIAKVLQTKAVNELPVDEQSPSLSSLVDKTSLTKTNVEEGSDGIKFAKAPAGSRKKGKQTKEVAKSDGKVADLKRGSVRERAIKPSVHRPKDSAQLESKAQLERDSTKPIQVLGQGLQKDNKEAERMESLTKSPIQMMDLLQNYYDRLLKKPWWPQDLTIDISNDSIMLALVKLLYKVASITQHFDVSQTIMEFKRMFPISPYTKTEVIDNLHVFYEEDSIDTKKAAKSFNIQSQTFYYKRALNDLNLLKCFGADVDDIKKEFMQKFGDTGAAEGTQYIGKHDDLSRNPIYARIDSKDLIRQVQERMKTKPGTVPLEMIDQLIQSLKLTTNVEEKILIANTLQDISKSQILAPKIMREIVTKTSALYSKIKEDLEDKILKGEDTEAKKIYDQFKIVSGALNNFTKKLDDPVKADFIQVPPSLEELKENPNILKSINKQFIDIERQKEIEKEKEEKEELKKEEELLKKMEIEMELHIKENELLDDKDDIMGIFKKARTRSGSMVRKSSVDYQLEKSLMKSIADGHEDLRDAKIDFKHKVVPISDTSKMQVDLKPTVHAVKLHDGIEKTADRQFVNGEMRMADDPEDGIYLKGQSIKPIVAASSKFVDICELIKDGLTTKGKNDVITNITIRNADDQNILFETEKGPIPSPEIAKLVEHELQSKDLILESTDKDGTVIRMAFSRKSTTDALGNAIAREDIGVSNPIKDSFEEKKKDTHGELQYDDKLGKVSFSEKQTGVPVKSQKEFIGELEKDSDHESKLDGTIKSGFVDSSVKFVDPETQLEGKSVKGLGSVDGRMSVQDGMKSIVGSMDVFGKVSEQELVSEAKSLKESMDSIVPGIAQETLQFKSKHDDDEIKRNYEGQGTSDYQEKLNEGGGQVLPGYETTLDNVHIIGQPSGHEGPGYETRQDNVLIIGQPSDHEGWGYETGQDIVDIMGQPSGYEVPGYPTREDHDTIIPQDNLQSRDHDADIMMKASGQETSKYKSIRDSDTGTKKSSSQEASKLQPKQDNDVTNLEVFGQEVDELQLKRDEIEKALTVPEEVKLQLKSIQDTIDVMRRASIQEVSEARDRRDRASVMRRPSLEDISEFREKREKPNLMTKASNDNILQFRSKRESFDEKDLEHKPFSFESSQDFAGEKGYDDGQLASSEPKPIIDKLEKMLKFDSKDIIKSQSEAEEKEEMIISQKIVLEQLKGAITSQMSASDQSALMNIMAYLEATDNIEKVDLSEQQVISKILSELFIASQVDQSQIGNISKEMMQHFIEKAPLSESTKSAIEQIILNDLEKLVSALADNKDASPEAKSEILKKIHDLSNVMKSLTIGNDVFDQRIEDIIQKTINVSTSQPIQDELISVEEKRKSLQTHKMLNEQEVIPLRKSEIDEGIEKIRSEMQNRLLNRHVTVSADLTIPEDVINNLLVQLAAVVSDTDKAIELSQAIFDITQDVDDENIYRMMSQIASNVFCNLIGDMQNVLCHTLNQHQLPLTLSRCITNLLLLQNLGIRDLGDFKEAILKFKDEFPDAVNFSKNPLSMQQLHRTKHRLDMSKNELVLDNKCTFLRNVKSLGPVDYSKGVEMGLILEDIDAVADSIYPRTARDDLPVMFALDEEDQKLVSTSYKTKSDLKDNLLEVDFLVKQHQMNPYTMKLKKDSFDSIVAMARDERPRSKSELIRIISSNPALMALTNIGTSLDLELRETVAKSSEKPPTISKRGMSNEMPIFTTKLSNEYRIPIKNIPSSDNVIDFKGGKRLSTIQKLPGLYKEKFDKEIKVQRSTLKLSKDTETKVHKNVERKTTGYKKADISETIGDFEFDTSLATLRSRIKDEICKEFPFLEDRLNFDGLIEKVKGVEIVPKHVLKQTKQFQDLYGKKTSLLPFIGKSKSVIGNVLDQGLRALHFNLGPGTLVRAILEHQKNGTEMPEKDEDDWWKDDSKRIDSIIDDDTNKATTSAKFLTDVQVQHCRMTNRPPSIPPHEWSKLTVPSAHHNLRPDLFGTLDKTHHCPHHSLAHKHLHRHGISIIKHLERYEMIEIINKTVQENAYIRIQNSLLKCLIRVLEEK